jgi:MFS transporter, MHS family, proline/betaine transporter
MPAFLCDLFPASIRTTGVAIVHDFTATLAGAFTPFMTTLLIGLTGSNLVPGFYVAGTAALALICVSVLHLKIDKV